VSLACTNLMLLVSTPIGPRQLGSCSGCWYMAAVDSSSSRSSSSSSSRRGLVHH
jgi:hypothetical protein